jgi:hypothetical protein
MVVAHHIIAVHTASHSMRHARMLHSLHHHAALHSPARFFLAAARLRIRINGREGHNDETADNANQTFSHTCTSQLIF